MNDNKPPCGCDYCSNPNGDLEGRAAARIGCLALISLALAAASLVAWLYLLTAN